MERNKGFFRGSTNIAGGKLDHEWDDVYHRLPSDPLITQMEVT